MNPLDDNNTFWGGSDGYVAVNPHRAGDAEGLAEFAASNKTTRSLIFFQTSGSEGAPKWCGLSREAMLASARAVNAHLEVKPQDRWLIALPLHHVGGFSILARCCVSGAAFIQLKEKWDAAKFATLCSEEKITLTSLVPTQVFDLVEAKIFAPRSMRAVVVGGAGLGLELGRKARELGWPVLQSYGMTETASQVATGSLGDLQNEFDSDRLEVLPIWELKTDGNQLLTVRGVALSSGYAIKESEGCLWKKIHSSSGLETRDRVELTSNGTKRFLSFRARDSSLVKILGELVNIESLQYRLESMTGTPHRVAICALADARRGTKLVLTGELPGVELEELRGRFNAQAIGIEKIAETAHIPKLPRSELGKLSHMSIRQALLGSGLGRP